MPRLTQAGPSRDEVTALVWNGAVVRIEDADVIGDTSMAPEVHSMLIQTYAWFRDR